VNGLRLLLTGAHLALSPVLQAMARNAWRRFGIDEASTAVRSAFGGWTDSLFSSYGLNKPGKALGC
jgi:hypothetical protein